MSEKKEAYTAHFESLRLGAFRLYGSARDAAVFCMGIQATLSMIFLLLDQGETVSSLKLDRNPSEVAAEDSLKHRPVFAAITILKMLETARLLEARANADNVGRYREVENIFNLAEAAVKAAEAIIAKAKGEGDGKGG